MRGDYQEDAGGVGVTEFGPDSYRDWSLEFSNSPIREDFLFLYASLDVGPRIARGKLLDIGYLNQ